MNLTTLGYVFFILIILGGVYVSILIHLEKKIKRFEKKIIGLFYKRTNLIPILHEISKPYITKHDEVFQQIIQLRKQELSLYENNFIEVIQNEIQIHHELNFIFKIANKHPKIEKNEKFLHIRDLFLENSSQIGKQIGVYKKIIPLFNNLVKYKNLSIVGMFFDLKKKTLI